MPGHAGNVLRANIAECGEADFHERFCLLAEIRLHGLLMSRSVKRVSASATNTVLCDCTAHAMLAAGLSLC